MCVPFTFLPRPPRPLFLILRGLLIPQLYWTELSSFKRPEVAQSHSASEFVHSPRMHPITFSFRSPPAKHTLPESLPRRKRHKLDAATKAGAEALLEMAA